MIQLRVALVLCTALILELDLFSGLRVTGVSAQLLLATSVAAGITGGPQRGAVFGFVAGLLIDLFLPTPFGLSAAAYALAAGAIGTAQHAVMERSLMTLVGFPALGTAIGLVAFVIGGVALGFGEVYRNDIGRVLVTVVLLNALLGFALVPITEWMWMQHGDRGRRARLV